MATVTFLNGVVGGLVATIVSIVLMLALGSDSLPGAQFWAKYVQEGSPGDFVAQGAALDLIYGVVAAAVFVLALPPAGAEIISLKWALVYGLAWGVILFVVAAIWMNAVLDMDVEPKRVGYYLVIYLLYGGILGAFVGYGPV